MITRLTTPDYRHDTTPRQRLRARPITICQVVHSLEVGGTEILVDRLARQLADEHRFVFACLDGLGELGDDLRGDGFTVQVLNRRSGLDWRCGLRLSRFMRDQRVDVVHAHQYTPFFQSLIARSAHRRPPILFTEHGRHFPDHRSWKRVACNRLLLEQRDRVVAVGGSVRKALVENEGIPPSRITTVYNGVDLSPYSDVPAGRRAEVRAELGLSDDDFVLVQVARLHELKDHATALRTVRRLAAGHPRLRLLVGDGDERAEIDRLVREWQLGDAVHVLGLRRDVPRVLAAADAFLLTSKSEGIPLTVIEAMAAGLPVVATRVGGLPEMVVHEVTGFLAPAGDDAVLADRVLRLLDDETLRYEAGQTARLIAFEQFSENKMLSAYNQLYEEMAGA